MTREKEIQERLDNAAPGPWKVVRHDLEIFVESEDMMLQANLGYVGNRPYKEAEFIAHSPEDIAYLLAELRKHKAALQDVRELAKAWSTISGNQNHELQINDVIDEAFEIDYKPL